MIRIAYALSIISGTIIGAGLFALPYLTLKTSPLTMLVYFVVLGIVAVLIHYFFAEAALKSPDFMRLPGFVKYHLGEKWYKLALISGVLGLFGANLAYIILGGRFLSAALSPIFGFGENFYTLVYFTAGALLIFFGIKAIGKVQLWGLILFFLSLGAIFIKGRSHIDISNLYFENDPSYIFMPYGVILFSLWGLSLIPEAEEILGDKRELLKKIIPFAVIIPIFVYAFFVFLVLGIMGGETPSDALTGLQNFLLNDVVVLALLLAVLTTFTSFIALGLTLKKILWYDIGLKRNIAWAITCFVPIILYFLGFKDFVRVVALVGGTMIAVDGILVALIYRKIGSIRLRPAVYPIIIALILGFIYEIADFFIWS